MKRLLCFALSVVLVLLSVYTFAENTVQIKKISFVDKSVTLAPETSYQLGLKVEPADASTEGLEWKSSNPKVVTVDKNGVVKGVAKGTAKVTVSATGGSKAKATVSIKVQNYDLVFKDRTPQKVEYSYGTGRFNISGTVKNGNVVIPNINGYVMASVMGGDGKKHEKIDVTPISAGEDQIVIKVNKKKFTYSVYVSQEVFSGPDVAPADDNADLVLLEFASVKNMKTAKVTQDDVYKLTTQETKDPGVDSNAISFQLRNVTDFTGYTKLVFSIKDLQGSNTHKVTIVDKSGKKSSHWIETKSEYLNWKRIEANLDQFSDIDLKNVKEIRIGEWNTGIYWFDQIGLAK